MFSAIKFDKKPMIGQITIEIINEYVTLVFKSMSLFLSFYFIYLFHFLVSHSQIERERENCKKGRVRYEWNSLFNMKVPDHY